MRSKLLAVSAAVVAALLVTAIAAGAVGRTTKSGRTTVTLQVTTRSVSGLGRILVNSRGYTLYMFVPDKREKVTCVKGCAVAWPPLKSPNGAKLVAANGVKASLLGTDPDPAGGRVVTYHGWPLYTYIADRRPGMAKGQALNANGGLWYVLSPSGAVIKKKVGATTTKKSGCVDRDFDGDESGGGPDDGDGCL